MTKFKLCFSPYSQSGKTKTTSHCGSVGRCVCAVKSVTDQYQGKYNIENGWIQSIVKTTPIGSLCVCACVSVSVSVSQHKWLKLDETVT